MSAVFLNKELAYVFCNNVLPEIMKSEIHEYTHKNTHTHMYTNNTQKDISMTRIWRTDKLVSQLSQL